MKKKLLCTIFIVSLLNSVSVYAKDITVTIPSYAVEDDMSSLPEAKDTQTLEDGSISYTLDEEQQKDWKAYLKSSFDDTIKNVLNDKVNYPNIENISYNEDMTEFHIDVTAMDNLTMSEYFVGYLPFFTAPVYQEADGISEDDIDYKLITTDLSSGEEITSDYEQSKDSWESMNFSASSSSSDSEQTSSPSNVNSISFDSESSSLIYSGFETMPYDSDQNDLLGVVKFNYSNKTTDPSRATAFYNIIAYQNGIELDRYAGIGNKACDNADKTILQDATIEVGFAFMLQDDQSPITIYAYDGFYSDSPCQIQEISIN